MASTRTRRIVAGLIIAVVVYVALVLVAGWDEVVQGAQLLSLWDWSVLLSLTIVHFIVRYIRWRWYLDALDRPVPTISNILIYMSGFALTTTPGKVGETWRSVYLQPHGVPYSEAIACFFAERYTDLLAIILLSMLAISLYEGTLWPLQLGCALVLAALLGLRHPKLPDWLARSGARVQSNAVKSMLSGLERLLRAAAQLLTTPRILYGTLLGLVAWGVQGVILYAVLDIMGQPIPFASAIGIYALGLLVGALSFLPGGLGSTEAVILLVLVSLQIDASTSASATLICRVATLWFAVLLGLLAVLALQVRGEKAAAAATAGNAGSE